MKSVRATDCFSSTGTGSNYGGKRTGFDSRLVDSLGNFGLSTVKLAAVFAANANCAKATNSKSIRPGSKKKPTPQQTSHDNGNIVKLNQKNDNISEELHQIHAKEKHSAMEVKEAHTAMYSSVQQHHLAEFQFISMG